MPHMPRSVFQHFVRRDTAAAIQGIGWRDEVGWLWACVLQTRVSSEGASSYLRLLITYIV